jgi:hypothetical protein
MMACVPVFEYFSCKFDWFGLGNKTDFAKRLK